MFMRLGQGSQPQFRAFSCSSSNMENKRSKMLQTMTITLLVSIIVMFNFSEANTEPVKRNTNINSESKLQTYIVFVKRPEADVSAQFQDLDGWYKSFLPATISSSDHHARIVHSYRNVVSGFAAKLTAEEAKSMQGKDDSISVRPEKILSLHTTRSPDFLGLNQNLGSWRNSNFGKGVIIGVLDTGISPNHPSFSDEGMPPPPAKWKGECEFNFTACNNKLIGARNFVTDEGTSPLDQEGHGTHTSSTAAGNFVQDANVFGNANGTAVGMAPLAHLAMYRVCSESGCSESSILAAMDAAVEDGVDILSISLGGGSVLFSEDSIAVGAFGAIQNGIFVSCSAGNDGPVNQSLSNEAPWILTVGASTIDRSIRSTVKLGNGVEYLGEGLFQPQASTPMFLPLVDAAIAGSQSTLCAPGSLKNIDVKGKIVLCVKGGGIARIAKGQEVKDAGGAGMILMNDKPSGSTVLVDVHVLPVSYVSYSAGLNIKAYINSTSLPVAAILPEGTIIGTQTAPAVASFSSRGPSWTSPGILKPDIIGPGVSILAAWSVSVENRTNTKSTFNIVSGTSMSCPHLSGIAALLKSAHPDWSPAAIKSAIMTTAYSVNLQGQPILNERLLPADILAIGAGHVSPSNASDPGLVYDLQPDDYIPYLCGLGYSDRGITYIVQRKVKCSEVKSIPEAQLNYPSFSIVFGPNTQSLTYTRTVTNVGPATSSYTAVVAPPSGVNVTITPPTITFSGVNQQATYSVTFSRTGGNVGKAFSQGYLKWLSDRHSVRSAILILFS